MCISLLANEVEHLWYSGFLSCQLLIRDLVSFSIGLFNFFLLVHWSSLHSLETTAMSVTHQGMQVYFNFQKGGEDSFYEL